MSSRSDIFRSPAGWISRGDNGRIRRVFREGACPHPARLRRVALSLKGRGSGRGVGTEALSQEDEQAGEAHSEEDSGAVLEDVGAVLAMMVVGDLERGAGGDDERDG